MAKKRFCMSETLVKIVEGVVAVVYIVIGILLIVYFREQNKAHKNVKKFLRKAKQKARSSATNIIAAQHKKVWY
jgi:glucose uptake protein GlcU